MYNIPTAPQFLAIPDLTMELMQQQFYSLCFSLNEILLSNRCFFFDLYVKEDQKSEYQIPGMFHLSLIYLTRFNFQWLRSFDQRVREGIEYAICINSVGAWENDLWMHISKPPENVYIKEIHEVYIFNAPAFLTNYHYPEYCNAQLLCLTRFSESHASTYCF
jgi:hypothetical protein